MSENGKQAEIPVSFNGAHPDIAMRSLPDNLAVKCPKCRELLLGKDWERNLKVCPRCGHHAQLPLMSASTCSPMRRRFKKSTAIWSRTIRSSSSATHKHIAPSWKAWSHQRT